MPSVRGIPWLVAGSIRKEGRLDFDLGQIPLDDQDAFELFRSGDTEEIMFFHCPAGREKLQRLQPSSIADLAAVSALIQVSVDHGQLMRLFEQRVKGSQCPEAVHPAITEVTADSRGLILFQEQVMMLLNRLGGITVADGFDFIKAVARRKSAVVAQYRVGFLESARENGIRQKSAEAIFGQLQQAASYVCCKATCVAARFKTLRMLDQPAVVPEEFDLKEYFGNAWAVYRGNKTYNIEIWFTPEAAKIVTETVWHHTQKVTFHDDGSATLSFQVDGLEEITNWVLGWAGQAKVIRPPELRDRVVDKLRTALELNSGG